MNDNSVKKLLTGKKTIQLPSGSFHRSKCYECKHFMWEEGVDSKGKCRCSWLGEWRFPNDGCSSGISISEDVKEKAEEIQRSVNDIPTPTVKKYTSKHGISNKSPKADAGSDSGYGIIILFLILGFIYLRNCAADAGIIKSNVRFSTSNESGIELTKEPDGATIVSASDPGVFYTLEFDTEADAEAPKRKLVKGTYYQYANEDRISVSCGSFTVNGYSDYTKRIPVEAVQDYNMVNTLVLTLTDADKNSISNKGVVVTGENGFEYACTAYGKEGTYIVLLFDDNLPATSGMLSIRVEGYSDASAEFDFSEKRICQQTLELAKE